MSDVKSLKAEAKRRGLKNFSSLTKPALKQLLSLDDRGQAPRKNVTNKRMKQLSKVGASGLTLEEEENYTPNPLLSVRAGDVGAPVRPLQRTLVVPGSSSSRPKKPAKSRSLVLKAVKAKKARECAKYNNLNKKSKAELMRLL